MTCVARLRLALGQLNSTVGDLAGNLERAMVAARTAAAEDADVLLLPEMHITGYPIEDLALRPTFVDASRAAVLSLATALQQAGLGSLTVVVGYLDRLEGLASEAPHGTNPVTVPRRPRGLPQNALAVLHEGRVVARYVKHHLPNYGVFDEFRYFIPGTRSCVVRVRGIDVGLAICEDLWQDGGPVAEYEARQPALLLVANGSPYERNKDDVRLALVQRRAAEANCTLAYVNMVGGQDELVFDGDSLVVSERGTLLARNRQFVEEVTLVDLDLPLAGAASAPEATISKSPSPPATPLVATVASRLGDEAEVYGALVLAVSDYAHKNGFRSVVFGFSGGIDSALTAAIAADALGGQNVHGVSMPSRYSSDHSKDDAEELARRLGCSYRVIPIDAMVQAFTAELGLTGLAEENLQARVRGTTIMGISNAEGHLVLATGNKSELSVGYTTIYGDAVGGFAPLKDVSKTMVWALARWRNADAESRGEVPPIPEASIAKPPSAELRPDQLDTDSLPNYELLDDLLDDYVEADRGAAALVDQGFDTELVEHVLRLTDAAEWKRRQYPPGPKISLRAFGRDRRLPITNRWRETLT